MSHTRRRDPLDVRKKQPDHAYGWGDSGVYVWHSEPTPKEVREAHMDGKKRHKPGKRAKGYLSKGAKAKTRRALGAVVDNPDAAPMPRAVKTHVWDYN